MTQTTARAHKKAQSKSKNKPNGAARFQDPMKASAFGPKTKGGKPIDDAVARKLFKEKFPVKIPADRVEQRADQLAAVIQNRALVLEKRRESMAQFREQLAGFNERLTQLAESVRSRSELRDVEVIEYFIPRMGEIIVVRQDTGETVESRAATAEDRQEDLRLLDNPDYGKNSPGDPARLIVAKATNVAGDDEEEEDDPDVQTFDDLTKNDTAATQGRS